VADEGHPTSQCPSCGRFVGPYPRCPYCGADVGQRISVRVFRYASLVIGFLGLAVLLFVARRSQVPVVEIGGLRGTMNWAYVRVEGLVTRQPTYDAESQTLRFWVGDGTGEIMVMAYRPEAEWLLSESRTPVMGDGIALEGTLRVREDFQYLILDVPQQTEIQPVEPVEMAISEVSADLLYRKVTVRGAIRGDRTPYEGLRVLTVRDATGEIEVALAAEATVVGGGWPDLSLGQPVQVVGAVDQYRGQPQVSVGRGRDLVVLDEPVAIAPARRTGTVSAADAGGMALVEGLIVKVDPFSAGVKYALDDGSGAVTLLLWQDLLQSLADREMLVRGATVRALGEVAEYGGELEVVPELPSDVVVVLPAEEIVSERRLGELTAADVGQMVRVEGVLRSLRTFSAGVKGTLDDGSGTVTLLLWEEVYEGLSDPASLAPGSLLRVEGEVSEYKGDLEVVPLVPADVTVTGLVDLPREERAIGQVTGDDVGQTLRLAGRIDEVAPFSKGVRFILDDDTGTIVLLVWQEVYDGLEDPAAWVEDARVAVRGEIDEYGGELEIVPQVPADLEVTVVGEAAAVTPTPTATAGLAAEATGTPEPAASPTSTPTAAPTQGPTSAPTAQPTPTVETRAIGSITHGDVGRTLTIAQASIAEVDYFSQGVKYRVSDGSGSIILLVWQDVMEEIPARYDLIPGSQVRVRGEIEEYEGDLEIIPRQGAEVVVLAPGERPPIEQRSIRDVTPSDEGRIFTVEGQVTRTESRGWLRVWIQDGTGEILIFVPTRTVEYLPAGIGPGLRLRVTGEVDIYQGVLEIIPLAGADVELP
jgi:DNA/RNA endonuclease YhcR with UshA esterase domain